MKRWNPAMQMNPPEASCGVSKRKIYWPISLLGRYHQGEELEKDHCIERQGMGRFKSEGAAFLM